MLRPPMQPSHDYQIAVNTVVKSEFLDNSAEPYPLLNFRGVTYFPLTWRFAVEEFRLGLFALMPKSGLSIPLGRAIPPRS